MEVDPASGLPTLHVHVAKGYGINIGCLEEVSEQELSKIPITYVDGMNDRWNDQPSFWQHL